MIILPVSTPAAAIDQNTVSQAQQNHTQSLEEARKANDTVKISSEAQQLAQSSVNNDQPKAANDPTKVQAAEASRVLKEIPQPDTVQKNPVTQKPENNQLDVVI